VVGETGADRDHGLALTGGLGILLGWYMRSVSALNLDELPRGYEIGLDGPTVA
jgi:hypothetical protein